MKWTRNITDDDVIQRVRRTQQNRGKVALSLVIVGVLSAAAGVSGILWLKHQWALAGSALKADPTRPQIDAAIDETTFYLGVAAGFGCGGMITSGMLLLGHGLGSTAWPDRRNELLLDYWDRFGPPIG